MEEIVQHVFYNFEGESRWATHKKHRAFRHGARNFEDTHAAWEYDIFQLWEEHVFKVEWRRQDCSLNEVDERTASGTSPAECLFIGQLSWCRGCHRQRSKVESDLQQGPFKGSRCHGARTGRTTTKGNMFERQSPKKLRASNVVAKDIWHHRVLQQDTMRMCKERALHSKEKENESSNRKGNITSKVLTAKEMAREFTWSQKKGNPQAIADGSLEAGLLKSGHTQWGHPSLLFHPLHRPVQDHQQRDIHLKRC